MKTIDNDFITFTNNLKLFKKMMMFLVHSNDEYARIIIANHGYGLDILINDSSLLVRHQLAKHGYGLEKLINDENELVRKIATKKQNETHN